MSENLRSNLSWLHFLQKNIKNESNQKNKNITHITYYNNPELFNIRVIHKRRLLKKGGRGVKNVRIYLVKRRQRGREGGHKIGKMGRRNLWMSPKASCKHQINFGLRSFRSNFGHLDPIGRN